MVKKKGFTLIDLLIAISVLSIIIGIGTPSFETAISKSRANDISNELYSAIQLARISAMTKNRNVTICGSNDGITCEKKWSRYLISFFDLNQNQIAEDDEVLRKHTINTSGHLLTRMSFGASSNTFTQTGYSKKLGSIIFCPKLKNPSHIRKVTWNRMGRPYKTKDKDKNGTMYLVGGKTLNQICLL